MQANTQTINSPDTSPAIDAVGKRRIAYLPFEDIGNAYTLRMREALAAFGEIERYAGVRGALSAMSDGGFRRYDLTVVNWAENGMVSRATGRISIPATLTLFARTLVMRLLSRKLVFVRHNRYPHGTDTRSAHTAVRLIDLYERMFDVVITHSGAEATGRRRYCPHPLYRQSRPKAPPSLISNPPRQGYFIVFGRIAPYKMIDKLIDVFPADRTLVVAGAIGDAAYAEKLGRIRRKNLVYLPGFRTEAQAQQLVSAAAGVVISNAEADVVVSGSFFYAISLGRPVFAVKTPFLEWVASRIGEGFLKLGADVDELCQLIACAQPVPATDHFRRVVRREFGDGAVRAALADALGMEP